VQRRIRKVTSYVCTGCYRTFPTSKDAKTHAASAHPPKAEGPKGKPGRRPKQTTAIIEAIKGGAHSAADIQAKTKIPLGRIHSLLSYLRRKGVVKGFKDKIKLGKAA